MSAPIIPTVADLSDRIYDVITDGFDNVFREYFHGPDVVTDDWYFRINSGLPHPMGNLLITGNQNNVGVLSDGIAPLCSDEFPSGVVCLGEVGEEADALLKARGFQLAEEMPAMAIDLQNLTETTLGDEYTFRQVGPDEHDLWVDAFAKGYELPPAFAERIGPAHAGSVAKENEEHRHYLVYHDDLPVSTSLDLIRNEIVEVYCISTVPEYRGKGLAKHVTAEPLRIAAGEGYKTAFLQASLQGAPVYCHLGFDTFGVLPLYVRIPAS
ncbi:MAG: hypothetical protein OXS32_09685 [Verrucomicrobiales bacterium]|nr:hypothetical protein [Verrucomicrobiales bacterium]